MAVTILDAITAATVDTVPTFTVSSGSNRIAFVLAVHTHGSNAAPVTSCTLGGQTMDVITTVDDDSNTFDVCMTLFALRETGIAAMSGSTITPTGGTYNNRQYFTWSVQGATQGTLTPATAATSGTSGSVSLTRVADSYTVAFTVQDYTGSAAFSGLADPSEAAEVTLTNGDIAYGAAADTARTANFTWTHSTSRNNVTFAMNIGPASTSPTITSTSDDTPTDGTTLTINGTNFGTNTGSAGITLGGTSVTPSSWTSTAIGIPIAIGSRKYGTNYAIVVTDSSAQTSNSWNVQIQPASGKEYVDLSGALASSGDRITAITDLASGDQLEISNIQGGTTADVTVNVDASFSVASGVTSFDVRANDGTGWGTTGTQNTVPDTTAPTLSSATIGTNGTTLTLVFSESVTVGSGGNGGFSVNAAGGTATCTYSSGSGSDTLVYTLGRTISSTEAWADLDYIQPGSGIEDSAGNDVVTFQDTPITNNSTQNSAPTDISITALTIAETAGADAIVGQLSSTDADYGDTHTYSLVAGTGDTDNASFNISGAFLRCTDPAVTGPGTYSVRIRSTDSASNTYEEVFSVVITDVLDDPINYITTQTGVDSTSNFTCEVGDILIGWASRDGSVTTPTMPSGWTNILSGGANTLGYRLAYKIATGTTETSGTWTNATSLAIVQYRSGAGYTLSIGDSATGLNSSGTNALYPALTLQDTSGVSHVLCGYAHRSADIADSTATTAGLTVRAFVQDATDTLAVHTAERVGSFAGATVTYTGTSASRRYVSVEIKATLPSTGDSMSVSRNMYRDISRPIYRNFI